MDEPGTVELEDDTDYVIEAPVTINGPVVLHGGRNVVWTGGHIRIEETETGAAAIARRGLVVKDGTNARQGRTVHVEGLLIDGADLAEGIDINAPSAIVQLQNVRIENVRVMSTDDLRGTGVYRAPNHPDIVQTWGSVLELRIDGLTGSSAYQGLFFKADMNGPHGPVWLRRVDLTASTVTGLDGTLFHGQRLLWWSAETSGPLRIDSGTVWIKHDHRSQWGTTLEENVHYPASTSGPNAAIKARDARAPYVSWPTAELTDGRPAVLDFGGDVPGKVYGGTPPMGEYVPEGAVGVGYLSPGYRPTPLVGPMPAASSETVGR